jgi:hypothetical protein
MVTECSSDSALPPEDWMGISKACLNSGEYCGKLASQS